ncbi:hypothetical protein CFC21_004452 [Triticum aestivum]|nr:hypothetical protein CFC21_004452 [Triticum aestivum]
MGKKPCSAGPSSASRPMNQAMSLREETSGKTQANTPSLLRVQHLQRLGAWATGEAGVGSIGALLGRRFAMDVEVAGIPGLLSSRKPVSTMLKAEHMNVPTVTTKKGIGHSVTAASQLESSSPENYKMEKGAVFSMVDHGQLAAAHKDILQQIEVESANDKCVNGIQPAASKNSTTCEHDVTSQAEFLAGSNFATPQKNKLAEVASAEAKSASNTRSARGDSTQPAGSSRKRARKGWTTLKQIAEKDELERKEKMDNFVIPFFMQ